MVVMTGEWMGIRDAAQPPSAQDDPQREGPGPGVGSFRGKPGSKLEEPWTTSRATLVPAQAGPSALCPALSEAGMPS